MWATRPQVSGNRFTYFDGSDQEIALSALQGADAQRGGRARVRSVEVQLIGMNRLADLRFEDPATYPPDHGVARHHRKFLLTRDLETRNVGLEGRRSAHSEV